MVGKEGDARERLGRLEMRMGEGAIGRVARSGAQTDVVNKEEGEARI